MKKYYFTSESVTEGHPDKVCDKISDAILDALIAKDPNARVAAETCCKTDFVLLMGEVTTTQSDIDYREVARKAILDIGYDREGEGFNGNTCEIEVQIGRQSPNIAQGVNSSMENKASGVDRFDLIGAGDQGMVFGYACTETKELMPMPISLAHKLTRRLTEVRKNNILDYLRPDGKSQVTVVYEDGKPVGVDAIVVSTQHTDDVTTEKLREDVKKYVIDAVIPKELINKDTKIYINPTGRFVIGGPMGDSGLTGRKIIVDTYGGYCPHGGGAFSGKDPTKVDRSAAYMARYACKNIVAAGLAEKCQIEVAYAIGVAHPVAIQVDTFGTGKYSDDVISQVIDKVFDFRPLAIIENLNLREPIFSKSTNYGHFGKDDLPWEQVNKVEEILKAVKEL